MFKKYFLAIVLIIFSNINLFAGENTQTQAQTQTQPAQSTAQREAEDLRRREEAIRRREEALRQRERALQNRERGGVRVQDTTGMQSELRRREQARIERERRRRQADDREFASKNKYTVGVYMGMSYLINPSKVDNSEKSLFGLSFGANFLYAIDNEYHIKVGLDISYATKLMNFVDNNYSPAYDVTTRGMFLLFQGRYDFLSRRDGHRFVPFANVYLGMLILNKNHDTQNSLVVTFGAGGGFDYWITKDFAVFLQIRFLMAKMNALPTSLYCKTKYQVWFYPAIGASFSF